MPRPKTKEDLMIAAKENYEKLNILISKMSDEELNTPFHLYEWHQLILNWVNSNQNGEEKPFIPKPYNWKTYGDLNVEFWKKHQNTNLEEAKEMLKQSHKEVLELADTFTNEELFSKDVYKWVGGSVLGSYFVSGTSSHYDWAIKKIKAHQKNCRSK